ncbi:MAG: hypothetical protein AAB925_01835 [Patescibacteria group bacterium]
MDDKDKIKGPECEISASEQEVHFEGAKPEAQAEKSEAQLAEIEEIKKILRSEVELMDKDPGLKEEAEKEANKIGSLGTDKLFAHFEEIAKNKGLVFAFNVAKKTNDFFVLDRFHDFMIENDRYKKFRL